MNRYLSGLGWATGGRYGWTYDTYTLRKGGAGGWEALDGTARPILRAATLDDLAERLGAYLKAARS